MSRPNRVLRLERFAPTLREGSRIVAQSAAPPGPDQVLVRQHFAGVNGLFDNVFSRGEVPYLRVQPPLDLGVEAVGVVEEVGPGVTTLSVGDAVTSSRLGGGYRARLVDAAAEFVRVPTPDARYVALRTSAVSALVALEQAGRMTSGEVVVITAAAGGLGQFLVQFARMAGNTVVGVCSGPDKAALLRRLGCHRPVDRLTEDFGEVIDAEFDGQVALAVDTVGAAMFDTLIARLAPRGRLVTAGHAADFAPGGATTVHAPRVYEHLYWTAGTVVGFQNALYAEHHRPALERILAWDAAGELEVAIDPVPFVGLESVADAADHLTSGRSVGKVVVDLRQEPATIRTNDRRSPA